MTCPPVLDSLFRVCEKALIGKETATPVDLDKLFDGEPFEVTEKLRVGKIFVDVELVENQALPCVRFSSRSSALWKRLYEKKLYLTFQIMAYLIRDEYDKAMSDCPTCK